MVFLKLSQRINARPLSQGEIGENLNIKLIYETQYIHLSIGIVEK